MATPSERPSEQPGEQQEPHPGATSIGRDPAPPPRLVPDDKNWTWVLERLCPDCGFDAASTPASAVAALVRDQIPAWREALAHPLARLRPSGDQWSALEYGCHVRDVFRLFDVRLGLMLTEDAPRFENWDQDVTAVADRYDLQDPAVVADELAAAASSIAARFDSVIGEQWARPGVRSDGASFTVESFARYFIHDPLHHLDDVRRGNRVLADGALD